MALNRRHTGQSIPTVLTDEDGVAVGVTNAALDVAEQYPDSAQMNLVAFAYLPTTAYSATPATAVSDPLLVDGAQSVTLFLEVHGTGDTAAGNMTIVLQGSVDGLTFFDVETALPAMNPMSDKVEAVADYMVQRTFCAKYIRLKCTAVTTAHLNSASVYWRP